MIYLYSGTPGAGKSLHQARDIYYWLRNGRPLIANFDINLKAIKCNPKKMGEFYFIDNMVLTPDILIKYAKCYFKEHRFKEGSIRLYLDECQLLFNAREWNSKGRKEWLSFFTQHRKYGYDIYLVAQFDRMVDRQIRSLIEYEVIHRRVKNFGFWGQFFNFVAGGSLFVAVKVWYPLREKVGTEFFKGSKKFYNIYDTFNLFGG